MVNLAVDIEIILVKINKTGPPGFPGFRWARLDTWPIDEFLDAVKKGVAAKAARRSASQKRRHESKDSK